MRVKSNKKVRITALSYTFFTFDKPQFNVVNYNILASLFIFNKTRRLMVARTKRLLKKKATASRVWVKLGKIVFLFKKALNSRMGKGTGSFFSVRRWLNAGSRLMSFYSKRAGFTKLVLRYIRNRLPVPVTFFVSRVRDVFKFRKLPLKFKKFKRLILHQGQRYYVVQDYTFTKKQNFLYRLSMMLTKKSIRFLVDSEDDIGELASMHTRSRFFLRRSLAKRVILRKRLRELRENRQEYKLRRLLRLKPKVLKLLKKKTFNAKILPKRSKRA